MGKRPGGNILKAHFASGFYGLQPSEKPAPKPDLHEKKQEKITSSSASRVHLSSFKELANAEKSQKTLWQRHNKILKGLSASIEVVDLGRKGRYHRIYAGPLNSYRAARDLCNELKNKRIYCRPVAAGAK